MVKNRWTPSGHPSPTMAAFQISKILRQVSREPLDHVQSMRLARQIVNSVTGNAPEEQDEE